MAKTRISFPLRLLQIAAICFLLSSCIEVNDFGEYWERSSGDTTLIGSWQPTKKDNEPLRFQMNEMRELQMTIEGDEPERYLARTLRVGKHSFLMIKEQEDDVGGTMHFYLIKDRKLRFYKPNEKRLEEFNRRYAKEGITATKEKVVVDELNSSVTNILLDLAADRNYWTDAGTYRQVIKK